MPAPPMRPEKGQPLRSLAFHKFRELSAYLNVSDRWRKVVDVMPEGVYSVVDVENFAMAMHQPGGSPAGELILDMGVQAFTVEQLASYLRVLRFEAPLLTLLPKEPVSIITQPENVVCSVNAEVQLKVEAAGLPFPQYQWYKSMGPGNNQKIRDARDSVLRIAHVTVRDRGVYCVFVFNDVNHVFSQWCEVQVMAPHPHDIQGWPPGPPPPDTFKITRQPEPQLVYHEGEIVKIRCCATGPGPLKYEWLINDRPSQIMAGSHNTLLIHGAKVDDTGSYRCRVTLRDQPDHEPLLSGCCHLKVERRQSLVSTNDGFNPSSNSGASQYGQRVPFAEGTTRPVADSTFTAPPAAAAAAAAATPPAAAAAASCIVAAAALSSAVSAGHANGKLLTAPHPTLVSSAVSVNGLGARTTCTTGRPIVSPEHVTPQAKLKGKVALVIGNQHYYGEPEMGPLYQTESDAAELASLLTSIDEDFRVVSLINLTAHEMVAAISYFVSLLSEGIYAVFYFAGHGFQYNNESYLLPVDIGLEDGPDQCIRAEDILYKMQQKEAKFSFLILDMCRTEQRSLEYLVRNNPPASRAKKGNYIVAHSCIPSHMAFERRSEENGIYMSHLKKHLGLNLRVEDVLMKVANSIGEAYPPSVQRPEYNSACTEAIYLHEKIVPVGMEDHKQYATLLDKWQLAHGEPDPVSIYSENGLSVTLAFYAEFSNVLIVCIHTSMQEKGEIQQLSIAMDLPGTEDELIIEDLTEKKRGSRESYKQVTNLKLRDRVSAPYCYRVCGIQKLRKNLGLIFKIRYIYNRTPVEKDVCKEFGAPLVASLNLLDYSTSTQQE